MFVQGSILGLLISTFLASVVSAQDSFTSVQPTKTERLVAIIGAVLSPDGRPLPGVPVELQDANSTIVARGETATGGSFALYNIPPGYYEVTSLAGGAEARQFVDLSTGKSTVNLGFLGATQRPIGADATVSVAQMSVQGSARTLYERAQEAIGKRNYDKGRTLLDEALQRQPEFSEALTLRAILERNGHEIEAAARDCEAALRVDPYYSLSYSTLASAYSLQGRYDDALRTLDEGVAISPRSWQMYFEMAKALIAKGSFSKALQLMDKAERLGGADNAEVHLVRAYALVPLKFYREARKEAQAFLARNPKGPNAVRAQELLASLDREPPTSAQPPEQSSDGFRQPRQAEITTLSNKAE